MYLWMYRGKLSLLGRSSNLSKNGGRKCNVIQYTRALLSISAQELVSSAGLCNWQSLPDLMLYSFSESQFAVCTFSLQYFCLSRCLLRKTLFLMYQLISSLSPFALSNLKSAFCMPEKQAVYLPQQYPLTNIWGFLMYYREVQNQCTTLVPAAQRCLASYAGWTHSWSFMIRVFMHFTWSMKD